MALKAVIFDLDGVIVSTVPLHFASWKKMFAEYGRKFTLQDYKAKVDGIPRIDGARAILPGLSPRELEKAAGKKQKYYLKLLKTKKIRVYKDALAMIKLLKDNGIKRGLISSSKNCMGILKKVNMVKAFDTIITGYDTKRGKPHPDIFLACAKRLGIKPKDCLVVEDAVLGVEAANRAKMKSIGIDRWHKPKRLARASIVTNDLKKLNMEKLAGLF